MNSIIKPYLTIQALRSQSKKNIDAWNECIESIVYLKYLILACNGKTIKRSEEENYVCRLRNTSISPFSEEARHQSSAITTETKRKDFDLINRDECRRWFKPAEIDSNGKYIKGNIRIDYFKPLLAKQHYFIIEDGQLKKKSIREIEYVDVFELNLPEKNLRNTLTYKPINMKFIDWNKDFWVHLLPSFYIDKIDLRTVNNLIAVYSEILRSKGPIKDDTKDNILWETLDIITDEILNFQLDDDGYFDLSNPDVYFTMSKLLSGSSKFYIGSTKEIKAPLVNKKFNEPIDFIDWAFNNFEPKHYHEICGFVFNYLQDPIASEISLNAKETFFANADTKIDLLIKTFDGIINRSIKDDYYTKLKKIADLYTVINKLPDVDIQTPDDVSPDDDFKVFRKRQTTLKKTFAMCILTELFYSDRFTPTNAHLGDPDDYNTYDNLLKVAIECLKDGFNGMDHQDREVVKLFEFCGFRDVQTHHLYFKGCFFSYHLSEIYIAEPTYRAELLNNLFIHNLIIPKDSTKFPNLVNLCNQLNHNVPEEHVQENVQEQPRRVRPIRNVRVIYASNQNTTQQRSKIKPKRGKK